MRDVIAYIDGFNLYNGLKQGYGRRYMWLDLERLSASLLLDDQRLTAVHYFTAPVRNQPPALRRQQKYWSALRTECPLVTIHDGRFQEKQVTCRSCGGSWPTYEEKETDVAIAVKIVEDAAHRRFDTALIISADSDLCPAVRAVSRLHPAAAVVAAFPPRRWSDDLRAAVTTSFTIAERKLSSSQLPDMVVSPTTGLQYPRPQKWR